MSGRDENDVIVTEVADSLTSDKMTCKDIN